MQKDVKIKLLIFGMGLTLLGLVIVQGFWFARAYNLREAQFSEKVNIALRTIAHEARAAAGDTQSRIEPVYQLASNAYRVNGLPVTLANLDSLLRQEFLRQDIRQDFRYVLYESETDAIVLGNYIPFNAAYQAGGACKARSTNVEFYDVAITFPNAGGHLLGSMGIWIFSSVALVAVLVIFGLLLLFFLKEKRLSRLKAHFVNNLTHELKTPITNISIASEVLRQPNPEPTPQRRQAYADIIHKETERLKTLVDRVLEISVLEKGKLFMEKESLDLHHLIREVGDITQPRIQSRKGQLHFELGASPPQLTADRHHLLNTLYNLIDNADKYSPNSPDITIRTRSQKEGIQIEVEDKGMGINAAQQSQIFGKFFRAAQGDRQEQRGFGLGLSYVQLIVAEHQGRIEVKSRLGQGSCFSIFLPYAIS